MHPPATDTIECKRTARFLTFLNKGSARIHAITDGKTVLVERADSQKLKLPAKTVRELLSAGLIIQARKQTPHAPFRIALSEEGRRIVEARRQGTASKRQLTTQNEPVRPDGSPLARLYFAKNASGIHLSKEEYHAGERLRADFEKSQLVGSLGVNWDAMGMPTFRANQAPSGGAGDFADAARGRVSKALSNVGPELAGLLIDVCCFLKGLERVEAERRWPRRSAKLLLKVALATLDRHYNPPPTQKSKGPSVWHSQQTAG